jgi:GNAT superfamily N-acetyltransferase
MRLRPAGIGDEREYARVIATIHPDETVDPEVLRARWMQEAQRPLNQGRFLILDGKRTCGIAFWTRPADWAEGPVNVATVNVRMTPEGESATDFARILAEMEAAAKASGADLARAIAREDESFHPRELKACGYRVDRTSRSWVLDLVSRAGDLLRARARAREAMSRIGIEIRSLDTPVSEATWHDLYALTAITIPDIPSSFPEPIPSFDEWRSKMSEPGIHAGRIWTAWSDDSLAAFSYLLFPAAGDVWTGYTATRRRFRGLGLARAVKLETIGQAIELGINSINTNNDLENAAILRINSSLGYEASPGLVSFVKDLRSSAKAPR